MAKGRADTSWHSGAIPRLMQQHPTVRAESIWSVGGPYPASSATSPREVTEPAESEPAHVPPQLIIVTGTANCRTMPADTAPNRPPTTGSQSPVWGFEPGLALDRNVPAGLSATDETNLSSVLDHEVSPNTIRAYRSQWQKFTAWAQNRGIRALPAEPVQVAVYLAERLEKQRHKPATLRAVAAAIAFVHRAYGLESPCASPEVKGTLKSASRKSGRSQKQAEALTAEALDAIKSTAHQPRLGRGGRLETQWFATRRANVDIAMISLMRDAMLRVSEAAALVWGDIETEADGTGRLLIRRSKTDPEGEGVVAFVSASTMAKLDTIRDGSLHIDSIFCLRPNQIAMRIRKAARAAGLGEGFSGHSPRVGMARDLARSGIELPSLMTAGRWRTPSMPALYIRKETAGRGAVAQFYGN